MKMGMRERWAGVIVAALIAGAAVFPQSGFADYIANLYITAAYEADTMTVDMKTAVDSLVVLQNSPEPRTVTDPQVICDGWDFGAGLNGDEFWPKTQGVDCDGARSAVIIIDFTDFAAGTLGVELCLGQTGIVATDTLGTVTYADGTPVQWGFDSANWPTNGSITIPVTVFEGAPMCGYQYVKLYDGGSLDIDATDISVRVVY